MSWSALLLGAGAGLVVLLLFARLYGSGRARDPGAPPRRKPRDMPGEELDRLTEMVGRGEEEEVRRRIRDAGFSEGAERKMIWLMRKLSEPDAER
jgi:hypothetical protein